MEILISKLDFKKQQMAPIEDRIWGSFKKKTTTLLKLMEI